MTPVEVLNDPRTGKDDKREAIIAIAQEMFARKGFAGTSMSEIAAKLGGSKGTLYNYFKSKDELFVAVIVEKCRKIESLLNQADIEGGGDLRQTLTNFGEHFLELILNDESIGTYRLATAESPRFPHIGQAIYTSGVQPNHRRLARFLEHAQELGQLRADADVSVAAEQFFDLCNSDIHRRRLWNIAQQPTPEEIRKNTEHAVDTFMRAFGS
jgi:TetR/AcrR family transcriptional repressor of mexJK operon